MDCSTNKSVFGNDFDRPWFLNLENGTNLYCNGSYPMNWVCNSTTKADADIAGPGVMTSFILVAWITVFVAIILAYYDLLEFLIRAQEWDWNPLLTIHKERRSTIRLFMTTRLHRTLKSRRTVLLRNTASGMLGYLCDLQIVTGLAIVIAGLAQMSTITFYHESLAIQYWWLTLNSFWAAQIEYMDEDSEKYTGRATIRRVGVLVSVVLAMVFQGIITIREDQEWDFLRPGYCYLYHDHTSTWPWLVSTCIYAVCLALTIFPATRPWIKNYHSGMQCILNWLIGNWKKSVFAFQNSHLRSFNGFDLAFMRALLYMTFRITLCGISSLCLALFWILLQFLAVWSYGNGFYPLLIFAYFGFAAWSTFDILDLKLSNRSLIDGQESSWGFGQVLPMVLLLTIGYNAVDAFRGKDSWPDELEW